MRARAHASGSERCSHDSFVIVNAATGTEPHASRPCLRSARAARPATRRPAPIRCRSTASPGRTTSPAASSTTRPCCCPATDDARRRRDTPAAVAAVRSASHHASGSCSLRGGVVGGCGARPAPIDAPGFRVAQLDLGRLRRRVDAEHDRHSLGRYMQFDRSRVRLRARRRADRRRRRHACTSATCWAAGSIAGRTAGGVETVVPKRRASAVSRCTPTAGSSARAATSCTCATAKRQRSSRSRVCRAGTTSAPIVPATCTAAHCGSRCSTAMRCRCRASAGASTRRGHERPGCTATSSTRTASRSRPTRRTLYHSDTRSHAVIVHTLRDDGTATDRRVIDTSRVRPTGRDGRRRGRRDLDRAPRITASDGSHPTDVSIGGSRCPSAMTTSVCLHGRDLYVATADNTDDPNAAGCLLHAEVDVAGAPVHPARV